MYVRVSTDKDEQVASIQNQIDICRYWIEKNGFEWDEDAVYKDEAVSGTEWFKRQAIQLILAKARKRELDTVIFKSIHRLARDLRDALEIKSILLGHGVRLVTIEEGYDSYYEGNNDMKFEMYAMFAAQYPKTMSVSISAAMNAKVRRGEYNGGRVPYGYRVVDQKYVIDDEESENVKELFDLYNQGLGYLKVALYMNDKGLRFIDGKLWSDYHIRHIINNPFYVGDYIAQKYTKVKVDGRRKQTVNPKEKWVVYKNHHPAIIERDLWDKIHSFEKKEKNRTKRRVSVDNELRGLVYCAHCGQPMKAEAVKKTQRDGVIKYVYMRCSKYRRTGGRECVKHVPLYYNQVRKLIVEKLKEKEQDLDEQISGGHKNKNKQKISKVNKEIKEWERKKEKLLDLYLDGQNISKEVFTQRDKKIDKIIREKNMELLKLNSLEEQIKEDNATKKAFDLLKNSENLYECFNTLIKRIDIKQNGVLDIYYRFEE